MGNKTKKKISRRKAKNRKLDRKTNSNNKKLMRDKILSYSPMILDGVEKYIDAHKDFWFLIVLGILLRDFPLIALPCCLLAMFFSIRMFQLIKYKSINNIVNELVKDLSFKGIYNQNKIDIMLNDFKNKYGQNIREYEELSKMLSSYNAFILKIESLLKAVNINTNKKQEFIEEDYLSNDMETCFNKHKDNLKKVSKVDRGTEKVNLNHFDKKINNKVSLLYRKKDGEVKKINRVIEFFEDQDNMCCQNKNTVILENDNKNNDKLKVYLYKKSVNLEKNAL